MNKKIKGIFIGGGFTKDDYTHNGKTVGLNPKYFNVTDKEHEWGRRVPARIEKDPEFQYVTVGITGAGYLCRAVTDQTEPHIGKIRHLFDSLSQGKLPDLGTILLRDCGDFTELDLVNKNGDIVKSVILSEGKYPKQFDCILEFLKECKAELKTSILEITRISDVFEGNGVVSPLVGYCKADAVVYFAENAPDGCPDWFTYEVKGSGIFQNRPNANQEGMIVCI